MTLSLATYLLFLHLCNWAMGNVDPSPRMIFTEKEKAMTRFSLPHDPPVQILLEDQSDTVLAAGQSYLNTYNFQNHKTSHKFMQWEKCNSISSEHDCSYNITLVHRKKDANQLFVCGTDGNERVCCNTDLTVEAPMCLPSENIADLIESIERFNIKEGEPSVFIDSEQSAALYITHSGSDESVGIQKFGKAGVGPKNHDKEQHYVGLVLSKREDPSQNRVYGFYKEKTEDTGLFSEMWLPFVTQVCMTDVGGPKNNLQFTWTSQMNARLFCGDQERKQHFSELVDVSTVDADRWQDTKIYALFRNEWGMSAVCVYTIEDINKIFENSPFNGYTKDQMDRPRTCAPDSSKLPVDTLKKIEKTSEMEQLVHPVGNPGLLFFNHHNYTHIQVDSKPNSRSSNQNVIFLSLNNGGIHKVLQNESHTFVIAEYQPFKQKAHVLSIILQSTFKKLYVNDGSQLVQLDVADCSQYGDTCQDCMLSRDPYCGWDGTQCIRDTKGSWRDAATGDLSICNKHNASNYKGDPVPVPRYSKYFLQCPVSSRHAQYSWQHHENSTACSSGKEQCLYLIDNMDSECKGTYKCISQEMGYSKVLVQYELQVENDAKTQQYKQLWPNKAEGRKTSLVIWVCLMMALIKSLSF
uniref:Semaphorin-7A-like n=1 Tax=Haplochromis burtoni TaxID=8153 RepID=A0A3Q2X3E8_HAPBU